VDIDGEGSATYETSAGQGGEPNGKNGVKFGTAYNIKSWSGGAGWALSFEQTSGNYGIGGSISQAINYAFHVCGATGGGGGYKTGYVTVSAGTTISISVGAAGTSYAFHSNGNVSAAGAGFVLIAYGGDI